MTNGTKVQFAFRPFACIGDYKTKHEGVGIITGEGEFPGFYFVRVTEKGGTYQVGESVHVELYSISRTF